MFFCEALPANGEMAQLRDDEARHATAARRLKPGDTLWLFDGRGGIARARLHAVHDRGRALDARIEERQQQAAPAPPLHLVCALPKGDRASVLLDMATQLGMTSFTPLLCERSVVDPGAGTLERLRRVCLEACKQSRRAHVPAIQSPATVADVFSQDDEKWVAHPGGTPVHALAYAVDRPLTLVVGPEGGFSDEEIDYMQARGATKVALGPTILRVEAAALALLAALRLGRAGA
jgi:16S rRNA (uracil1498-N3)-methyltransferase